MLKTKFMPFSTGEAVDLVPSRFIKVISRSRGDIGVGGARLLLSDDPAVKGGCRVAWYLCSIKTLGSENPLMLMGERWADSTPDLPTRPETTLLFPPADTMRRIGEEIGLSDGRRKPSACDTVLGPSDGRLRRVSAVRAAGFTAFLRLEAISVGGGGDLNGIVGAGGEFDGSDSATS